MFTLHETYVSASMTALPRPDGLAASIYLNAPTHLRADGADKAVFDCQIADVLDGGGLLEYAIARARRGLPTILRFKTFDACMHVFRTLAMQAQEECGR